MDDRMNPLRPKKSFVAMVTTNRNNNHTQYALEGILAV